MQENQVVDIKSRLTEFMPVLIKLLGDEAISWSQINLQFKADFQKNEKLYFENNNYHLKEASIYDIIMKAHDGDKSATRLFTFFNRLIEDLIELVPKKMMPKLKKTIFNLLTNFNKNYLNFFGELGVLNNLLKSDNYLLEDIEYPLGNGNFIDFKLFDKSKNKPIFIEVVNIHPSKELSTEPAFIKTFLSKRINDKVRLTKKHSENNIEFTLVPVIWAPHNDLRKIYDFFRAGHTLSISLAIEPLAYISFYNSNTLFQRFTLVSKLFNSTP